MGVSHAIAFGEGWHSKHVLEPISWSIGGNGWNKSLSSNDLYTNYILSLYLSDLRHATCCRRTVWFHIHLVCYVCEPSHPEAVETHTGRHSWTEEGGLTVRHSGFSMSHHSIMVGPKCLRGLIILPQSCWHWGDLYVPIKKVHDLILTAYCTSSCHG